jgi:hypothetical protein
MLRNRFDQFGKNILHDVLRLRGEAQTEAEVPPGDAQRIDVWFVPDETRQRAGPSLTGLLAALAEAPALIELWSGGFEEKAFHSCLRKRYAWHHALEIRDRRDWTMPPLWGLCAGRPSGVLSGFGFEPAPEGPTGHYRTAAPSWRARLVVLPELPRVRDTILLRLLGHRAVRRQAMQDLKALPEDAYERAVAQPWLVRLKFDLEAADPTMLSPEDKEIAMDVHEWFEQYERDLKAQHERDLKAKLEAEWFEQYERDLKARHERDLKAKLEAEWFEQYERDLANRFKAEGLSAGLQPLVHQFERRLGRPLTPSERATLVERLREQGAERVGDVVLDLSPEDLAVWLGATNGH